jgi:hypothetical protein
MADKRTVDADMALPVTELTVIQEDVIDARICLLRRCPKLGRVSGPDGTLMACCNAAVHKARFPFDLLQQTVQENPDPVPGTRSDENPLLFRLLMSPECLRPECGRAQLEYRVQQLAVHPADKEDLFA